MSFFQARCPCVPRIVGLEIRHALFYKYRNSPPPPHKHPTSLLMTRKRYEVINLHYQFVLPAPGNQESSLHQQYPASKRTTIRNVF